MCGKAPCVIECSTCHATWCSDEHKSNDFAHEGRDDSGKFLKGFCPSHYLFEKKNISPMFEIPGINKTLVTFERRVFMAMPPSEALVTQWNIVKLDHPCWDKIYKEWKKNPIRLKKTIGAFVEVQDVPRLLILRMGKGMDDIVKAWAPGK